MRIRIVLVVVALFAVPPGVARGDICPQYGCNQCAWSYQPTIGTGNLFSDRDDHWFRYAEVDGLCGPFALTATGVAINALGPFSLVTAAASSEPAESSLAIKHINTCKACARSEGNIKAESRNNWKIVAEINDHGEARAKGEATQDIVMDDLDIRCHTAGGAEVATAGGSTWAFGVSVGPRGPRGGVRVLDHHPRGNPRKIARTFTPMVWPDGSTHCRDQKEIVEDEATLTLTVNSAEVAADGGLVYGGVAELHLDTIDFSLRIVNWCDNCTEPSSRDECTFPAPEEAEEAD